MIWRGDEQGLPPARSRLVSPYDTDARYAEKRGKGWTGYKVHLSETCHEPDAAGRRPAPNLITNTETTPAPVTDVEMTEPVHHALARRGLTPGEHAADSRVCQRGPAAGRPRPRHHPARPGAAR